MPSNTLCVNWDNPTNPELLRHPVATLISSHAFRWNTKAKDLICEWMYTDPSFLRYIDNGQNVTAGSMEKAIRSGRLDLSGLYRVLGFVETLKNFATASGQRDVFDIIQPKILSKIYAMKRENFWSKKKAKDRIQNSSTTLVRHDSGSGSSGESSNGSSFRSNSEASVSSASNPFPHAILDSTETHDSHMEDDNQGIMKELEEARAKYHMEQQLLIVKQKEEQEDMARSIRDMKMREEMGREKDLAQEKKQKQEEFAREQKRKEEQEEMVRLICDTKLREEIAREKELVREKKHKEAQEEMARLIRDMKLQEEIAHENKLAREKKQREEQEELTRLIRTIKLREEEMARKKEVQENDLLIRENDTQKEGVRTGGGAPTPASTSTSALALTLIPAPTTTTSKLTLSQMREEIFELARKSEILRLEREASV